jgi:hypothetical protein
LKTGPAVPTRVGCFQFVYCFFGGLMLAGISNDGYCLVVGSYETFAL